jgi:uncharacterized membrane protein (UPF0136 family)
MFETARLFLFAFGALSIAGGVLGFVKAKSKASLIAGGASGVLLAIAAYLMGAGHLSIGLILGLIVSVALAGRFIPQFIKTKKPMPAGMMSVLAAAGIVLTGLSLIRG